MADKCTPRAISQCEQQLQEATEQGVSTTPWSICLPWGGQLYQDETGVHAVAGNPPADGVYDRIVVANGCIVGALKSDAPVYVGSPCAPLPGDCAGSGGGGGSDNLCNPSDTPGNLYRCDFSGRPLVTCTIAAGAGTVVTGSGTTTDPYVITASGGGSGGVYLRSDNEAIKITGGGTRDNPYVFAHKEGFQTTAAGLVFDAYGHCVGESGGSANAGVQGIIGGDGIKVDVDNRSGIYTVGLDTPLNSKPGDYLLGGYNVTLDQYNRISDIQRSIDLGEAQTFTCGDKTVTVNGLGSIIGIQDAGGGSSSGGGGGLIAAVYFGNVQTNYKPQLEADFILPSDASVMGEFVGTMDQNSTGWIQFIVDSTICGSVGNHFWVFPAVLGAGTHHLSVRTTIPNSSDENGGRFALPAWVLFYSLTGISIVGVD